MNHKLWNPNLWNGTDADYYKQTAGAAGPVALWLEKEPERADAVVLARAITLSSGLAGRVIDPAGLSENTLEGLQQLRHFRILYRIGGEDEVPRQPRSRLALPQAGSRVGDGAVQPTALWVEADIESPDGTVETARLPVDFAVMNRNPMVWPTRYTVLIEPSTGQLDVPTLWRLIENACFEPRTGPDADRAKTQQELFEEQARGVAEMLLLPRSRARTAGIERTAVNALRSRLEEGDRVVLTGTGEFGAPLVDVTLANGAAAERERKCAQCQQPMAVHQDNGVCDDCRLVREIRALPEVALLWGRKSMPYCPICLLRGPARNGGDARIDREKSRTALCARCQTE